MKVITEAILRSELRASEPEVYYVENGKMLSPAAREYLQQRKIKIAAAGKAVSENTTLSESKIPAEKPEQAAAPGAKFVDYETGAYYNDKPEYMTHLHGNVLVVKNHPRIRFRGMLDSLQALIIINQTFLAEKDENQKVIHDLSEILDITRKIMRCDVMDEALTCDTILGLTHAELRERSHDPMKYYKVKQMVMPDYTMGRTYAILNQLRTAIRETEVAAADAFRVGTKCTRPDIVEELNRLSSTLHIMMCMHLAGQYR